MSDEKRDDQKTNDVAECLGRFKHSFVWVWGRDQWTDKMRCQTCGFVREKVKRFEGQ